MLRPSALLAMLAVWPSLALGAAFEIDSRTEAQVSQLRAYRDSDPSNPVLLPRRRLVEYLGVNAYELIPNSPLGFESSLRVFADFGLPTGEAARIDGLRSEDADLLFANVYYHGKDLDFRIGRQLYTDITGIIAFDGASFRYTHQVGPMRLGAEVYSGLWVKAGSALGSSVYQPDGIRESNLQLLNRCQTGPMAPGCSAATPYAALDDIEPLIGVKAIMTGLAGLSADLGFKQAWLSGQTDVRRLTADAKWTGKLGITLLGGAEYDLLLMRVGNARLEARLDRTELAFALDVLWISPLLSADSIFYYFAWAPHEENRFRVDWFPSGMFRFYVQGLMDVYSTPLNNVTTGIGGFFFPMVGAPQGQLPSPVSGGASAGGSMRTGPVRLALNGSFQTGWNGSQVWLDVSGGYVPPMSRVSAEARLSVANVNDAVNLLYRGTYFGAQLWGSYLLTRAARFSLVLEQNFGPATKSDTKLFVLYDLKAVL